MTDSMELVGRLENGSDRFLKWAYKEAYSGAPVISIPHHPDNIDALLIEAAACIREMVEWRPIETAPRDGTVFVAISISKWGERYDSQTFKPFGCWRSKEGWAREVHGFRTFGNHVAHPTHWLPLPPAPGAEA